MAMGDALADEVRRVLDEHGLDVDVVIPVGLLATDPGMIYQYCRRRSLIPLA